jgi:SSS family solute:Na+ symporter
MAGADLAVIDYAIIALYFIAVGAIAVYTARSVETGDDLFLAGRSLRWPVIGGSLFASNISSATLIGLAGAAYASGISVANYEWMAGVVLVFMGVYVVPVYLRARIGTIPELLEKRFDRRSRLYFSALTILLTVAVDTAGGIYAGAVVLRTFFPGLGLAETCAGLALVAGLYTAAGGLKAVAFSDVLQAVVLILGSTLLTLIVFGEYDFDWTAATATVPDGHLSLIRPLGDPGVPWLGLLIGLPVLGFWYWGANQYVAQRLLGAENRREAQWGANLGGALKLLPLFIMVLPGAMAIGLFPDLDNPDRVFPTLVAEMLPAGLTGLVLAGLIAAIMSSIDSTLNSSSTLIVKDFVERPGRELSPRAAGRIGRATTLTLMVVAALWAPMIARFGGLFDYLQQAFSVLAPPVTAVMLLGIFQRRGAGRAAIRTLLIGHALGIGFLAAHQLDLWPVHYTITAGVTAALSAALFLRLAREDAPPTPEALEGLIHAPRAGEDGDLPLLARPRVQAAAILAATALVIVAFA